MPDVLKQTPAASDWWILGAVGLLALVAVFLALAETSLTRMSGSRALQLQAQHRRGARQLARLLEHPAASVNTVLLLVVAVEALSVALFTTVMIRLLGTGVGVAVSVVAMTVLIYVVTEVAPKTYALQHSDRVALATAPTVLLLTRLPLLGLFSRLLIRLGNLIAPGSGLRTGPFVPSEDEIMASIDEATAGGAIEQEEREMLQSVFEFGDTVVREVMVPRTDMVAVDAQRPLEDVLQVILRSGYSRIPVYDGDADNVVGLAYAKDVLRLLNEGKADRPLTEILRQPPYMPESMRASDALREMRRRASHMAIVIDEYGGTAGLVTIEDLLEEIVGEIADEYDREEPNIEPLPDGSYRVNARLAIDEVNELLGAELPDIEWDTIGGLLINQVGDVPKEGQEVDFQGLRLRAERVQGHRVGRVRIRRLLPDTEPVDTGETRLVMEDRAAAEFREAERSQEEGPRPATREDRRSGDAQARREAPGAAAGAADASPQP